MRKRPEEEPAYTKETQDGKFIHSAKAKKYRGQEIPAHFVITKTGKPKEGEVIGYSRFGQTLYWISNSVVAKG